jgi:uncharacterized protein YbjT (DUF2867 family)
VENQKFREKVAVVFGATGLIGGAIVKQLTDHDAYGRVLVFTRRASGFTHDKITEHIVDFKRINEYAHLMKGEMYSVVSGPT